MTLELSGTLQNSHGTLFCYPEVPIVFKAHCAMCADISKILVRYLLWQACIAVLSWHTNHGLQQDLSLSAVP